jgi:hypothetical protein
MGLLSQPALHAICAKVVPFPEDETCPDHAMGESDLVQLDPASLEV